jgi:hypothetical protein
MSGGDPDPDRLAGLQKSVTDQAQYVALPRLRPSCVPQLSGPPLEAFQHKA